MKLIQAFRFLIKEPETFIKGHNKLIGIRHFTKDSTQQFQLLSVSFDEKSFINDKVVIFSCFFLSGELFKPADESFINIHPCAGDALLFQHNAWHEGKPVLTGSKYVLRSDLFYTT